MRYCYENAILALAYYTTTGHQAIITFRTTLVLVVARSEHSHLRSCKERKSRSNRDLDIYQCCCLLSTNQRDCFNLNSSTQRTNS